MKNYLSGKPDLSSYAEVADECCIWSAPFGLKLLNYIRYKAGITAVDIGPGTGFPLIEVAMRLGESSTVYGIDPWMEAAERARKKIEFYQLSNIRLINGYAESIPLEDSTVDLVMSNNGINNVKDIDKVISECSRITKPGGQFVQTFNLDKTMVEFYLVFESVLNDLGMEKEIRLMYQHIWEKRRPLDELISMVSSHGFIIKDIEQDQFDYRFSNGTAMLNHFFMKLAFLPSWKAILPSNRAEEIFDRIEKKLNEQAKALGEFKLSIPFVLINALKS
jgi:ubiquinone/menaquinone biosynthesis C-methylase UbiE